MLGRRPRRPQAVQVHREHAGRGVALSTRLASSLTDRVGSGRTALAGGVIAAVGTAPFVPRVVPPAGTRG